MYGISNSQQQGGGGGGAASYKAIRASLTYADWQEVAGATPYFVGDDATTWAKDSDTQQPMKISNSDLGIIAGQQYTITIEANGVEYSSTASADNNEGMLMIMFTFSETANATVVLYDHFNWATKTVGDGSAMMVNTGQNTSLLITKFEGEGFGSIIQATISDSAIKVNSAVTMYTNTREKISVGTKTNGSVTLIAPSIPTSDLIPYSLEIVGTDTEGLFELINGYVPEIPSVSSNYDDFSNIPIINQDLSESGFTAVKDTYYRHTGTTNRDYTNGVIYKCVDVGSTSKPLRLFELSTIYDVQMTIPSEKDITNESTNVSITGSASPYLFTVTDSDIRSYSFVRLYPMDEDTETWLNDHTSSSIITEESGKFTFKVDTNTLPTAYSMKYVIENFM